MTQANTFLPETVFSMEEDPSLRPTITVTPATKHSIQNATQLRHKTGIRVAAYCRVSTGDECQQTSYARQKSFYTRLISEHPGWSLAGIYADTDVSGTNTDRRVHFRQMIADCQTGKIDYIITKSISRFARNTVDTLNHVRMLKKLSPSVGVFFEKENVDTLDAAGELLLTILSALAQDESRSISDNVRWAYSKKFQSGIAHCNLKGMMGYDKGDNGQWVINEQQAQIVRQIYDRYLTGDSACQIARDLNAQGIRTLFGKLWDASAIMRMLRNEKYMGDCELQKTIVKDFLTHHSCKNCGEAPKYYVRNHHSPIISREKWNKVQIMIADLDGTRRHSGAGIANPPAKRPVPVKGQTFYNLCCGEMTHLPACDIPGDGYTWDKDTPRQTSNSPENGKKAGNAGVRPASGQTSSSPEHGQLCGGSYHRCVYSRPIKNYSDERSLKSEALRTGNRLNSEMNEIYKYAFAVWRCCNRFGTKKGGRIVRSGDESCTAPILYETALEQSFMEMLYRLKRDYEANGETSRLACSFRALPREENGGHNTELTTNFCLLLSCILKLPEQNAAGMDILVSGLDCHRPPAAPAPKGSCSKAGRSKIERAPDLLPFKRGIYTAFVEKAVVYGDEVEYRMSYGGYLKSFGNQRTLEDFCGYRRCSGNGVELIGNVWEVSGNSIQYRRFKKRQ